MTTDERYMARCLQLAANGRFETAPNPMVGAVIVHDGQIIGEGYHRQCGGPHAEVNAIRSVKEPRMLREATMYVSLEPCAHYGKTPPCADLIVAKGIPRVVVGCRDSFGLVDGKGIQRMRQAGIEVTVGVLERECQKLNSAFFVYHAEQRPYIVLKWAQSADGYIDYTREKGEEKRPVRFSTDGTAPHAHRLRALSDAILVGRRTAELDNPSLTTRQWPGKNPTRVVIDRQGRLDKELQLFDETAKTIVFTDVFRDLGHTEQIEQITLDFGRDILPQMMRELHKRKLQRLLVEGGSQLLQSFIDSDLWDEAYVEVTPWKLGTGVKAPNMKKPDDREQWMSCGHHFWHFERGK